MPLAMRAEGWRTPHTMPPKPIALSNSDKCPNQHLWVGPSAEKHKWGGICSTSGCFSGCWDWTVDSPDTEVVLPGIFLNLLLFYFCWQQWLLPLVAFSVLKQNLSFVLGKKIILLLLLHPAKPHTIWQCDPSRFYNMGSFCQGLGGEWCY